MQFKANKLALLAAVLIQETDRQAETKISVCDYTNANGERCQLQLVATSDSRKQVPVDPRGACVQMDSNAVTVH